MRRMILAALVLSPVLVQAQPLKLKGHRELAAAASRGNVASTSPLRISTGVTPPKLISTVDIQADSNSVYTRAAVDRKIVVSMVVDTTGAPTDVKIVDSNDPDADSRVLAAVSQYRFVPGQLDAQPIAVPMTLDIVLRVAGH